MRGQLGAGSTDGIVADEEASGHGEPDITHDVGIAEEAGEAVPVWEFELAFRSVDDGFAEGYGKADGGIQDLVIICEVVYVAAEIVGVEAELVEEASAHAQFEVVAVGRLKRKAENVGIERDYVGRAGQKNILE